MRIDYSIGSFTFTVGSFTATDYLDSLKLRQGYAELGRQLTWQGDFELSYNRRAERDGLTHDDFDPITTPSRWRPDQQPVTLTLDGSTFPKLRIKNYVYNPQTRQGKGTLYQVLDIVAGDRPAAEVKTTLGSVGDSLLTVTERCLATAFAGATLVPTVQLTPAHYSGKFTAPLTTRDPVKDAQAFTAANYSWLWVDHLERIRSVQGEPAKNPVLFQRSLSQVEWEPDLDAINFAAEQVIVTGNCEVPAPINLRFILKSPAEEKTHDDEGRQLLARTKKYAKLAELFPDVYTDDDGRPTNTQEIEAERTTITYHYFGITSPELIPLIKPASGEDEQAQVLYFPQVYELPYKHGEQCQTVTLTEKTQAELFPDEFPEDTIEARRLVTAEKTLETNYCKITLNPRGVTNPEAYPGDTQLEIASAEGVSSGRVEPDGTVPNQTEGDGKLKLEEPPQKEPRQKKPPLPFVEQTWRGEAKLQPVGWTPFRQKPFVEDVGFIPDQSHADYLAQQIALREVRRRDAIAIVMPIPAEWRAAGFPPLHRCQIHNAELQIDDAMLVLDGNFRTAKFSFTGGRIGTIATIPNPPMPPPYVPVAGLAFAPLPPIRVAVGTAIAPVILSTVGGTAPFTVAAVDSLPAGLSLSPAGEVTGTPTVATAGAYYTVQVTDGAATVEIGELWVQVVAVEAPILPVMEVVEVEAAVIPYLRVELLTAEPLQFATATYMRVEIDGDLYQFATQVSMQVTISEGGGGS